MLENMGTLYGVQRYKRTVKLRTGEHWIVPRNTKLLGVTKSVTGTGLQSVTREDTPSLRCYKFSNERFKESNSQFKQSLSYQFYRVWFEDKDKETSISNRIKNLLNVLWNTEEHHLSNLLFKFLLHSYCSRDFIKQKYFSIVIARSLSLVSLNKRWRCDPKIVVDLRVWSTLVILTRFNLVGGIPRVTHSRHVLDQPISF